MIHLPSSSEMERNSSLAHANGATTKTSSEPFASARMSSTATLTAWRKTNDSTVTSALLKLMEN